MQQVNTPASYSMAKALHYIHFAKQYFEDAIRQEQLQANGKYFINQQTNRLNCILKDVYARMSPQGAVLLRHEIESRDIAAIDSIINMVIEMDEETRLKVEGYCEQVRNINQ